MVGFPDLDGDGRGEVFGGGPCDAGPDEPACSGRGYLFSGATGALLHTFQSDQPMFAGNFGVYAVALPDADGDGVDDIVLGTGFERRALIYSGATRALLRVIPAPAAETFALTAACADLDGDGVGDILFVSRIPASEDPFPFNHRVYAYSGATGALLHTIDAPPGAAYFGQGARGIPDLDGDGRAELVLPSYRMRSPGGAGDVGRVFIYSGAAATPLREVLPPTDEVFQLFGWSVAVTPDFDGDGRSDLLIGALFGNNLTGAAHLVSGATGRHLRTLVSPNPRVSGHFAYSVAAMAYPSGPRRGAAVVGAPQECPGCDHEVYGAAYVFLICRADSDVDGRVDSRDIVHFLTGWLATRGLGPGELPPPGVRSGDHDGDGAVTAADISAFLGDWLGAVAEGGCL